jgi:glycosyltransferase involved in cell wall biosynthesis
MHALDPRKNADGDPPEARAAEPRVEKQSRGLSLAVVATHPIQYQCPVWRRLASLSEVSRLKVFYASDFSVRGYRDAGFGTEVRWESALMEGYPYEVYGHGVSAGWNCVGSRRLIKELIRFRPDACLINAYLPLLYLRTIVACRRNAIPVVLRAEATDVDQSRSRSKGLLRDAILRQVYGRISAFAAIGVNAREHYLRLGIEPSLISRSPYCIDSALFDAQAARVCRGRFRASLGVPADALVVLFSGKLIPKKDPLAILRALHGISEVDGMPIHVWFLGDGELRSEIEALAELAPRGRVRVLGFRPQSELGDVYTDADVMVLPSVTRETWGLVVNEALTFGVPVIVSDRVGCAPDLVSPGETGLVFPHGDVTALRDCLLELLRELRLKRDTTARHCKRRVSGYSTDAAGRGIVEGACLALARDRAAGVGHVTGVR